MLHLTAVARDLFARVSDGDRSAFDRFIELVGDDCWRVVRVVLHDDEPCADRAYVDAMSEVWRRAPRLDPAQASPRAWAMAIAQECAQRYRGTASRCEPATLHAG